jgi:hypothetical protein
LKERLASSFLALVSVLVCLSALELAARLTVGRGTEAAVPGVALGRYHPLLGWEKTPGSSARIARSEYDVEVAINPHGLRGPDRPYEKGPSTKRVLILGDSFAEGYYVEEGETVRALLEGELQRSLPGAEVLNGATAGYSTDQEYLFYTSEGVRYRPDLVLLFVFSNDLPDNLLTVGNAGRGKPVFALRDGGVVLENTPVPSPRGERPPGGGGLRPFHHSVALRWLSDRTAEAPRMHGVLARLGLVPPLSADPPRDFWPFRTDKRREQGEMWARFEAILLALQKAVTAGGGRLLVVYVPIRFEVEDGAYDALGARYPPSRAWDRDRVTRELRRVCDLHAIPLLDPRPALKAAGGACYFPKDGHWNVLGNRVVAQALQEPAQALLRGE